jgi:hypothetical protein
VSAAAWLILAALAWAAMGLLAVAAARLRSARARLLFPPGPRVVPARLYDPVAPFTVAGRELGGERERPALLVAGLDPEAAALAGEVDVDVVSVRAVELPAALRPLTLPAVVGIAREGAVCALGSPRDVEQLREAAHATAGAMLAGAAGSQRTLAWGASTPFWAPGQWR